LGGQAEPLYVVDIDPASEQVVVGSREDLKRESFKVGELHWVAPEQLQASRRDVHAREFEAIVQVRSRHRGVKSRVLVAADGSCRVSWVEDWTSVSPGQAAVFYDLKNEEVLGGGRIERDASR
jgi:tRNA-specific 2-thiouridylase